mmetsp:Transcript_53385/g.114767  ORF Transcript_53385/g.114767 Transcript_53385/m.114767 type:complete len:148 (+) Transcript_53385:93-536(+)
MALGDDGKDSLPRPCSGGGDCGTDVWRNSGGGERGADISRNGDLAGNGDCGPVTSDRGPAIGDCGASNCPVEEAGASLGADAVPSRGASGGLWRLGCESRSVAASWSCNANRACATSSSKDRQSRLGLMSLTRVLSGDRGSKFIARA